MRNTFQLFTFLIAVAFLSRNANAQSSSRPWSFSAGLNAVNLHGGDSTTDITETKYWNTIPAISHLSLARTLNPSLALDLQLYGSRITTLSDGSATQALGFVAGDLDL